MVDEVRKYVMRNHTNKGLELDKRMSRLGDRVYGFIENLRVKTIKVREKGVSI